MKKFFPDFWKIENSDNCLRILLPKKSDFLRFKEKKTVVAMSQTNINCYTGSIALENHVLSWCPSISNSYTAGNVHSRRYSNSYYFRICTTHFPKRLKQSNMNRTIFRRCCLGNIWIAKDSGLSHYIVFFVPLNASIFLVLSWNYSNRQRIWLVALHRFFCALNATIFLSDLEKNDKAWCFCDVKTLAIISASGNHTPKVVGFKGTH